MEVVAKFKGLDGSCGYVNGLVYRLFFDVSDLILIRPKFGQSAQPCKYMSLRRFLDNWEVLPQSYQNFFENGK